MSEKIFKTIHLDLVAVRSTNCYSLNSKYIGAKCSTSGSIEQERSSNNYIFLKYTSTYNKIQAF